MPRPGMPTDIRHEMERATEELKSDGVDVHAVDLIGRIAQNIVTKNLTEKDERALVVEGYRRSLIGVNRTLRMLGRYTLVINKTGMEGLSKDQQWVYLAAGRLQLEVLKAMGVLMRESEKAAHSYR